MLWLLALSLLTIVALLRTLRSEDGTIRELLQALDQSTNDAACWRMLAERFEFDVKLGLEIISERNGELAITQALLDDEMCHNEQLVLQLSAARRTRDGYKLLWQKALEKQRSEGTKPQLALAR